jgi:hypothetical protein
MSAIAKRQILRNDVMPTAEYAKIRANIRREVVDLKKQRRVAIGPHATFYFESYQTMWLQVHEMLYIEKGGAEQIAGELEAYNPMIPNGSELTATVMFEIPDADRRKAVLASLGGIEETAFISVGGETIKGVAEADQDRTNAAGKASSVQFIHFPFTKAQIEAFRQPGAEVVLGFKHPNYGHMMTLPESVRQALSADFD